MYLDLFQNTAIVRMYDGWVSISVRNDVCVFVWVILNIAQLKLPEKSGN